MPTSSSSSRISDSRGSIGLLGAAAIGIGGMVGGGIFAVLGLALELAGGAAPVSFLVAGTVALLTASSYAALTVAYPSRGGTVVFVDKAFGADFLTGSLNTLLWLSYIVTLSLYAVAFANYAATFFPGQTVSPFVRHLLISGGVLLPALINLASPALVGKTESIVVGIKLAILVLVVAVGLGGVDASRVAPSTWGSIGAIAGAGMLMFVAYEGFELIANAAPDIRNPKTTVPRAYLGSVGLVVVLYVLIAIVTAGSLSAQQVKDAADFALAEAARPSLGQIGFTLVAVAALLATFSAINATLFGSARLSATIAEEGELPTFLARRVWNRPAAGLALTALGTLLLANTVNLSKISALGSAGFLLVFAAVNGAALRLDVKRKPVATLGLLACLGALGALIWHTATDSPGDLFWLAGLVGLAVLVETVVQIRDRTTSGS